MRGLSPGTGKLQMLPARAAGCKGRGGQRERGERSTRSPASEMSPPHLALLCPAFHLPGTQAVSSANPPSRKLHRQYSHCQQPSLPTETCLAVPRSRSQGRRRRREGGCTARGGNLSTPPSQSKSQALPCSRSVLPATGWPAGRAAVCGEHEPAPSNELHGKQTLPMQD